jgi:hypothetical protein
MLYKWIDSTYNLDQPGNANGFGLAINARDDVPTGERRRNEVILPETGHQNFRAVNIYDTTAIMLYL